MQKVLGGFEKLVGSLVKPGEVEAKASTQAAEPAARRAPERLLAADTRATLTGGRPSALGLEPAVTLEGIASTLNRIYAAQVA